MVQLYHVHHFVPNIYGKLRGYLVGVKKILRLINPATPSMIRVCKVFGMNHFIFMLNGSLKSNQSNSKPNALRVFFGLKTLQLCPRGYKPLQQCELNVRGAMNCAW